MEPNRNFLGSYAERIRENPFFVEDENEVPTWYLLDLIRFAQRQQTDLVDLIARINSNPTNAPYDVAQSPNWHDAKRLEAICTAELQRRKSPQTPTVSPTAAKKGLPAPLIFKALFVSPEAMERALNAARAVGLINDANIWDYKGRKGAICVFWKFIKGKNVASNVALQSDEKTCQSIAKFWQTTISPRTTRCSEWSFEGELTGELRQVW